MKYNRPDPTFQRARAARSATTATRPATAPIDARLRQRQFIDDARALLRPSEVTPSTPNRFRLAFLRTFPGVAGGTAGWHVVNAIRDRLGARRIVHEGQCAWWGRQAFVIEPYDVSPESLNSVAELAKALGCECRVSPNGWHFRGSTWRIVFFEKDREEGAKL
jgi:hypothetical protein